MDRAELERLTLSELLALAAERGIEADGKDEHELIELLAPRRRLVDRAKEAVAHAAERVEARAHRIAERLRPETPAGPPGPRPSAGRPSAASFDVPSSTVHPHADELETLSMARLYAAEGELERALELYEKLAALDPADESVAAELAVVRAEQAATGDATRAAAPPVASPPPRPSEPLGMLDLDELPDTYGVDECEVLFKDPYWVFAYWEVTEAGLSSARAQLGPSAASARLVLRLFTTIGSGHREVNDVDLPSHHGRRYLPAVRPGAHLRVAVGLLSPEGYFAPIAHSSLQRIPHAEPAPAGPVEWMEVVPTRTRGREKEPLVIVRRGGGHSERGIAGTPSEAPGGSSSTTRPPWEKK
jgi:hypothetical protein